jgi:hypothetical protein
MSKPTTLTEAEVEKLFNELSNLEEWVDPKPDPTIWPPRGWEPHPTEAGLLVRVVTEDDLREEIFGSEQKTEWLKWARARIEEIKRQLAETFFPKAKDEGTQRKTKWGFVVMLKTGLQRKFDLPALAPVIEDAQAYAKKKKINVDIETKIINWQPKLKLADFRELPADLQKRIENALIITPEKPVFEITRVQSED